MSRQARDSRARRIADREADRLIAAAITRAAFIAANAEEEAVRGFRARLDADPWEGTR